MLLFHFKCTRQPINEGVTQCHVSIDLILPAAMNNKVVKRRKENKIKSLS